MNDRLIALEDLPPCKGGISRRSFVAGAGTGLVVLGAAACTGDPRVFTGSIDDPASGPPILNDAGQPIDFAHQQSPNDGGTGPNDLSHSSQSDAKGGGTCSGGLLNAGAASAIAVGSAKHFSAGAYDLFVCRDANGYFTVDAQCTHSGCDVKLQSGRWHCPCHGANFNFDGTKPTAPAFAPLNNYAVCVDASGNLQVDYNTVVSPSTRG